MVKNEDNNLGQYNHSLNSVYPFDTLSDIVSNFSFSCDNGYEWSHNGQYLATGYSDGSVKIINQQTELSIASYQPHNKGITDLDWTLDDSKLASVSFDNTVSIWDTNLSSIVHKFDSDEAVSVLWEPNTDNLFLGSAWGEYGLTKWNSVTETLVQVRRIGSIVHLSLDKNLSILTSTGAFGGISFTNPSDISIDVLPTIIPSEGFGDQWAIYTSSWHSNGSWLATGSVNGAVQIWDVTNQQLSLQINTANDIEINPLVPDYWHTTRVVALAFMEQQNTVVSLNVEGHVQIWDINTGNLISEYTVLNAPIDTAAFNPDGTQLAYGSSDGTIAVVETSPAITCTTSPHHPR